MHRYTIEDIKNRSAKELLLLVLLDREEKVINPYSPMAEMLMALRRRVEKCSELDEPLNIWNNKESK